jgi:hypothetical protein
MAKVVKDKVVKPDLNTEQLKSEPCKLKPIIEQAIKNLALLDRKALIIPLGNPETPEFRVAFALAQCFKPRSTHCKEMPELKEGDAREIYNKAKSSIKPNDQLDLRRGDPTPILLKFIDAAKDISDTRVARQMRMQTSSEEGQSKIEAGQIRMPTILRKAIPAPTS